MSGPKTYTVTLTGRTPLIMHADSLIHQSRLEAWRSAPQNKDKSVRGDDRSPPWTWQTYVYTDGENVVMPQENLRSCLMEAGKKCPKVKGRGTLKVEAVSGVVYDEPFLTFKVGGKVIPMASIITIDDDDFLAHVEKTQKLGVELLVKRATVGTSKHVRVRPLFRNWSIEAGVTVVSDLIDKATLLMLFETAGRYVGIGDWRPSAKKAPGPYGQFEVQIK